MVAIRMSEAQYRLLFGGRAAGKPPRAKGAPRAPWKRREDLPENILAGQIRGFLEIRGWRIIRQQSGLFTRPGEIERQNLIRVGEKGRADWMACRCVPGTPAGTVQMFEYETKAPGRKLRPEQRLYLDRLAATGFVGGWFDDFDGDWDTSFVHWYRKRFGGP